MTLRQHLLLYVVKWFIENYKFTEVISVFWKEYRKFYNEDNYNSALASVIEVIEDAQKEVR